MNTITYGNPAQTDLSAWFKTMWDDNYLYLFIDVTDDALVNDGSYWGDDVIGIFIDSLNDDSFGMNSDDMKIILKYGNTLFNGIEDIENPSEWASLLHQTSTTGSGYQAEVAIPFSLIGITPSEGYTMGFDIAIYDDDDGGGIDSEIRWTSTAFTGSYISEDTSSFGDLILKAPQYHRADTNQDGCITMDEIPAFIDLWHYDSTTYPMREMMEGIALWKSGTGC